ncbi:MAG TPA: thioredoxin domain-containing protein [Dissulfurispiraceae bacterium]|nr:thioredoxin domain-containing protein [Dissulfurispiraceae bacterium]
MAYETSDKGKNFNRLIREKSPYLLQHATNPVDWYSWGPEAFEKAEKENKPIFLSIGYSTCHWCHVMESESFEDQEVARLLNETFISIKVDREERPDIDQVYMEVCQIMAESCGWPLTIMMTPDKKPFFAGTYIPKENRFGRMGMLELIPRIKATWEQQHEKVLDIALRITVALKKEAASPSDTGPGEALLETAYEELAAQYDAINGGFGRVPKFPTPHRLFYLLRFWKRTGNARALDMVEKTLPGMRNGGMYDHLGFGFHRYSTDAEWLLPHFEKMLYDQALLSLAYTEAYQATGKKEYMKTAEEILSYVRRDMTSPSGAFYSAEDADSEGVEGKFYTWSLDEIRRILGTEADLFVKVSRIEKAGNFVEQATGEKTGQNIVHLGKPLKELAVELKDPVSVLENRLEDARRKLLVVREKRIRPHKDDKILTDWNGLMIAAFAKAGAAFCQPEHIKAAKTAADFILSRMSRSDGRLLHRYRDVQAAVPGNASDYAFLVWGLIEIYEASFEVKYLRKALDLNNDMFTYFWDDKNGGFFFTASDAESLLVRKKELYDGAAPSGNSIAMLNLLRLGRLTANPSLESRAGRIGKAFVNEIKESPSAYTQFMCAVDFALGHSLEIVIAGDSHADDTRAFVKSLSSKFLPNAVFVLKPAEQESPEIAVLAGFTQYQKAIEGKATAYVCHNYACAVPTTDMKEMFKLLEAPLKNTDSTV